MKQNSWCEALGISTPDLRTVKDHREAVTFSLLLVALLERGEAMTLLEVAARFATAGVAPEDAALASLKRCRPGRPPVYRDGDHYHLDPHDSELDLWAFRLGLRPPKVPALRVVRPPAEPLLGVEERLTVGELDEAWRDASLRSWSARRLALCVLDALGGPKSPAAVVAFVAERTRYHSLGEDSTKFKTRGCPVAVLEGGRWDIAAGAEEALLASRTQVRSRLQSLRSTSSRRTEPAVLEANRKAFERKRRAHAEELARLRRVLLVAFPAKNPRVVTLLNVQARHLETLTGAELGTLPARLSEYDWLGAIEVRAQLRALGFDPGQKQLAELGPPQKTMKINQRGRTLKITPALLVQGSCGIASPFGEPKKLAEYLERGQESKLRRRLEADAKSLFALYQYGKLHGAVRLRWGFLDERLPAPWVHRDEPILYQLKDEAMAAEVPLEVVVGSAPGWEEPWARARLAHVVKDESGWRTLLVDDEGFMLDDDEIQLARLARTLH